VVAALPSGRGLISAHAGNGSSNILTRLEKELRQFMPNHVVVLVGTNDTDVNVWKANIAEIVERVEACGATCWLGAVPAEASDSNPETEFNPWLRTNYPGQVIGFDYALTTGGTGLAANRRADFYRDTLHPNDAGYSAMYARVQSDALSIFS
jgi:lysophospholipase L1-like esterase